MAYPPVIPPATRTNATVQLDNHPADHNALATALAAMPWGRVASVQLTAGGQTGIGASPVDLTGALLSFTAIAGRKYRVGFSITVAQQAAGATFNVTVATHPANGILTQPGATVAASAFFGMSYAVEWVGSGATQLKLRLQVSAATINVLQGVANPTLFYVDDVGPV